MCVCVCVCVCFIKLLYYNNRKCRNSQECSTLLHWKYSQVHCSEYFVVGGVDNTTVSSTEV